MPFLTPVTLTGDLVTLSPLSHDDEAELNEAAADGELWDLPYTWVPRPEGMAAEIARRLAELDADRMLPFTARRVDTGEVIGMTTLMNVDGPMRHVEIGSTWNRRSAHRTGTNTESKLLLLTHAFQTLDCIAVELRTHWLNRQSRQAIERLGAKLDGILRSHLIMPNGTLRDTAVYSILPIEWPAIRANLRYRLDQNTEPG